jgi:arylamine N-acetyltransferase
MSQPTEIRLDPANHAYAVRRFMDYFVIKLQHPDDDTLRAVLSAFAAFPYENISKIIKLNAHFLSSERVRLPEEVMEDYEHHRLGGTCFSLSFFLHSILYHLGFHSYIVMANMGQRANVHCCLVVLLNDRLYLVDPGYLLTQPMQIHPDRPRLYKAPHSGVELRFDSESERYRLFTFDLNTIKLRYDFSVTPTPLPEFLGHWLASFYQGTMHGICLTQLREDQLVYLHGDYLQITNMAGKSKQHLGSEYERTVRSLFGIAPEWLERAQEAMARNMELEQLHGLYRPKRRAEHETD